MRLPWWLAMLVASGPVAAATWTEGLHGDLSNDRLEPTPWQLDGAALGGNGETGHNILTGQTGRAAPGGAVDRDYLAVHVPAGYTWTELRVGQQTQVGGATGAFIGLAQGPSMPVPADATSAQGLLGWHHYGAADRGTDILGIMSMPQGGSAGFDRPLPEGTYTLWIQELAVGSYAYRFNLVLAPVPEPAALGLATVGGVLLLWLRRARRAG
jgi:hypothetical protein